MKQARATTTGQEVAQAHENSKSQRCVCCRRVAAKNQVFKQCSGCKAVRYCGQSCQKLHWSSHKRLCQATEHLETQKRSRVERGDGYVLVSHLTPKQHVAVANLVGKKCKVSCVLNGVPVEALGTQVHRYLLRRKVGLENICLP